MKKSAIILLAVAFIFLTVGICRGEAKTVLDKGSNLCLECVGIG